MYIQPKQISTFGFMTSILAVPKAHSHSSNHTHTTSFFLPVPEFPDAKSFLVFPSFFCGGMKENTVINQKAWQLITGTTYVQASRRITNTQKIKSQSSNTKKIIYLHYILFILTFYPKFKYNKGEEKN